AERIAADERPAVDRLWIGLADPTHASDEGGRLRPGDTLVRRSNHLDIVALPELAVLVAHARLDVEEAVDKCAVGQNDNLVGDRLVLRAGIEDRPRRLPARAGRRAIGRAREPDRAVVGVRELERRRGYVVTRRDDAVPDRVDEVAARIGRVCRERLLVIEVVTERDPGLRGVELQDEGLAPGRAAVLH